MILVDSSVWIDFFNGRPTTGADRLALLLEDVAPVAIADLVLFEVLRGFRHQREFLTARRLLAAVPTVAVGGEPNALAAVDHDRHLRALGYTVRSAVDLLQASFCIAHDHALLHSDADFDAIERLCGLKVWRH